MLQIYTMILYIIKLQPLKKYRVLGTSYIKKGTTIRIIDKALKLNKENSALEICSIQYSHGPNIPLETSSETKTKMYVVV